METLQAGIGLAGGVPTLADWHDEAGIALHWSLSGRGDSGLVLIHELGGSLKSFQRLTALLESRFRILRFDQRGAGLSEKPRSAYGTSDLVDDMGRLVDFLPMSASFWILGAAAGAAVAVEYCLRHPEQVRGLILCGPALSVDPERRAYLEARSTLASDEGMRAVIDATLERSYPNECRSDAALFLQYRHRLLACDPVAYALANRALGTLDTTRRLDEITVPSLVLAGRHDRLRPPEMVRPIAGKLRHGSYVEVESCHLMAFHAPDLIAREILSFVEFAERVDGKKRPI